MRAQEQQRILKILQQGLATHTSADAGEMLQVPMEGYTDPEQLALEQTMFFKQTPLMLGLSSGDSQGHIWKPRSPRFWLDGVTVGRGRRHPMGAVIGG